MPHGKEFFPIQCAIGWYINNIISDVFASFFSTKKMLTNISVNQSPMFPLIRHYLVYSYPNQTAFFPLLVTSKFSPCSQMLLTYIFLHLISHWTKVRSWISKGEMLFIFTIYKRVLNENPLSNKWKNFPFLPTFLSLLNKKKQIRPYWPSDK